MLLIFKLFIYDLFIFNKKNFNESFVFKAYISILLYLIYHAVMFIK